MFAEHQPRIALFARADAVQTAQVAAFCIATINQHFNQVPPLCTQIQAGDLSKLMWWQREAVRAFQARKWTLHDTLFNDRYTLRQRHALLVRWPGLGIAKAGFLLQLTRGEAGCIDRHNARVLGMKERTFQVEKGAPCTQERIDMYLSLCASIGSELLWDAWCTRLAANEPTRYRDPEHVSALHLLSLGIEGAIV